MSSFFNGAVNATSGKLSVLMFKVVFKDPERVSIRILLKVMMTRRIIVFKRKLFD
jgi:hypothetical protein